MTKLENRIVVFALPTWTERSKARDRMEEKSRTEGWGLSPIRRKGGSCVKQRSMSRVIFAPVTFSAHRNGGPALTLTGLFHPRLTYCEWNGLTSRLRPARLTFNTPTLGS